MQPRIRHRIHPPQPLHAGAAVAAWLGVVVVLNITANPLVGACAFLSLAVLARALNHTRLVLVSLLVGLSLLLVMPGLGLVAGDWRVTFGPSLPQAPRGLAGFVWALMALLRVPAQVLAVCLLLAAPVRSLLRVLARVSPRSAIIGALAARSGPLLVSDAIQIGEEAYAADPAVSARAGWSAWTHSKLVLQSLVTVLIDRSFSTADALRLRGYGAQHPTRGAVVSGAHDSHRAVDMLVAGSVGIAVVVAVVGRMTGLLPAPHIGTLAGLAERPSPITAVLAVLVVIPGWATTLMIRSKLRKPPSDGDPWNRMLLQQSHSDAAGWHTEATVPRGAAITLQDVCVTRYGASKPCLRVTELHIPAGSCLIVAGAAGSGKSTLLDLISGVIRDGRGATVTGTVTVDSTPIESRSARDLPLVCSAVFQDPDRQIILGTPEEEIALALRNGGVDLDSIQQRIACVARRMEITHLLREDMAKLSGGELQRVMIAAAVAQRPAVMVLDEPLARLDDSGDRAVWNTIAWMRSHCATTVVVAHHGSPVEVPDAQRVWVHDGELHRVPLQSSHAPALPVRTPQEPQGRAVLMQVRGSIAMPGNHARILVRDLHLDLVPGMIVGIVGDNGSGKTTLLRTLRGVHGDNPYCSVTVQGRPVGSLPGWDSLQMAYLPQRPLLAASAATCREFLHHCALQRGLDVHRAEDALYGSGLGALADVHPLDLSGGQRQLLQVVGSSLHWPPVWLLDEPTRSLDAQSSSWVIELMQLAAHSGSAIVVTSHDTAVLQSLCTHQMVLRGGGRWHMSSHQRSMPGVPV